jgi:hypothetical protein
MPEMFLMCRFQRVSAVGLIVDGTLLQVRRRNNIGYFPKA